MSDYGPYYAPEKYGLQLVRSADAADSYEFDMIGIWKTADGRYLISHDSGCSCPVPFEDTRVEDMTEVKTLADVQRFVGLYWSDDASRYSWIYRSSAEARADLLDGLTLT